jgi:hypothetical protein
VSGYHQRNWRVLRPKQYLSASAWPAPIHKGAKKQSLLNVVYGHKFLGFVGSSTRAAPSKAFRGGTREKISGRSCSRTMRLGRSRSTWRSAELLRKRVTSLAARRRSVSCARRWAARRSASAVCRRSSALTPQGDQRCDGYIRLQSPNVCKFVKVTSAQAAGASCLPRRCRKILSPNGVRPFYLAVRAPLLCCSAETVLLT